MILYKNRFNVEVLLISGEVAEDTFIESASDFLY